MTQRESKGTTGGRFAGEGVNENEEAHSPPAH